MPTSSGMPIETSISATVSPRLRSGAAYLVKRMLRSVKIWKNRRALTKLATLDDYMLKDIGLTRGDVRLASTLPYSDDPTSRLRILAVERRASERAWAREVHYRRSARSKELLDGIEEQYRSGKSKDDAHC